MSLPPEYVPLVQDIAANARAVVRQCEAMLKEIGTASEGACRNCDGTGVVAWTSPLDGRVENNPCGCPKGAPFRAAAAQRSARDRAAGRDG